MSRSRTTATDLARFLDHGAAPVYVLDDNRRIVYCNSACAAWIGLSVEQLIGQQCSYHAPAEANGGAAIAGLCPPPKVFSGHAQTALVSRVTPEGRLAYRRGHFLPLAEGQDESAPVIAVLETSDCPATALGDDTRRDAQLHEHVRHFRHQMIGQFAADSLIGRNPLVVRVRQQVELAARSGTNVLIVGPRGSGKDHAAKAIHYAQTDPGLLVPLDCAVLETNVLRSSLRTLAVRSTTARLAGGTVLLDDVDSLPAEAQQDLLEMLLDGSLKLRVIATSCRSLAELSSAGQFLAPLALQLATLVIEMPSLAQRLDDLPLLAQALLEEINAGSYRQVGGFTSEALDQLAAYPWPGNIDELRTVLRETHEHAHAAEITPRDLPKQLQWGAEAVGHAARGDDTIVLEDFLGHVERELIARAMRRAKNNKSKAARLLGLTRPRLYRRLVQLGLEQPKGQSAEPKS